MQKAMWANDDSLLPFKATDDFGFVVFLFTSFDFDRTGTLIRIDDPNN